jgi:hypothetical protein
LSRSEVVAASERGSVETQTRFADGSVFTYALEATRDASGATASYKRDRMVVRLPASEIAAWANDDDAVSLRGEVRLADGGQLRILVEKDFRCRVPPGDEDQSDLFQNPEPTAC